MDKKSKQEKTEVVEATSTVTHYNKAGRERQPAARHPRPIASFSGCCGGTLAAWRSRLQAHSAPSPFFLSAVNRQKQEIAVDNCGKVVL